MVNLVAMFNLPPGTDEADCEKYFVKDIGIKLPSPPKKRAKKAAKGKGGKKR